ncbi:MAG TPA: hypothetical protein VFD63_14105 [Pyrinomonadaceae bacterium]|nr:hypothetical protein [Pyrinomonadaceae bacterium]
MQTHATKWLTLESRLHRECVRKHSSIATRRRRFGLTIPGAETPDKIHTGALRRNIFGARAGVFAAAHLNMSER